MTPSVSLGARRFRFQPLTPIHVGSGERISPEEYVMDIERREVVRLRLPTVLAAMAEPTRKRFESALDQGRLKDAQAEIQRIWLQQPPGERAKIERYRAECGDQSFHELRQIIEQPGRSGDVMALLRNPFTGNVTVPGSALKGAIRTALVSRYAQDLSDTDKQTYNLGADGDRKLAREMETRVLNYTDRNLERDPLRLLTVSDIEWPAGLVRIDKTVLRKLGRDDGQTSGIQMHFERLKSFVDNVQADWPTVELRLAPEPDKWKSAGRRLDWEQLRKICNDFFLNRYQREVQQFPAVRATAEYWGPTELDVARGSIFIRIGRHSHFDSASVEGFRRKPESKSGPRVPHSYPGPQIGSTRTMCPVQAGREVPFGWALLEPV